MQYQHIRNSWQKQYTGALQWETVLRAFPKSLLFLEGCIITVCAFIHAWLGDFTHPMPMGKDPPYRIERQTDLRASSISRTHYFPVHPPFLVYTLTDKRTTNIAVFVYYFSAVTPHEHAMCVREQNAMMVCSKTQLYGSVHRFMGLIIWTHSHHTSDSYLQLQFLLVPSHYCFGTQNIVIRKRNDYLAGYQAAESFKGHHLTGNRPGTTVYFITEASLFCNSFPVDKVW